MEYQNQSQTRMNLHQGRQSKFKLFWPIVILLASLALGIGSAVQGSHYVHYFIDLPYIGQLFQQFNNFPSQDKDESAKQISGIVLPEMKDVYL